MKTPILTVVLSFLWMLSAVAQSAITISGGATVSGAGQLITTNTVTGGGGGGGTSTIAEVGAGGQRATSGNNNAVDSATLAYPGNVGNGQLLIVGGSVWGATAAPTSIAVSDTRSTSYTVILGDIGAGLTWRTFIAYGVTSSSGANTVTVNPAGVDGTHSFSWTQNEYSGQNATPLDVNGGTTAGSGTTVSGNITTIYNNALIVGVVSQDGGNDDVTPGSGFTQVGENPVNSNNQCHMFEHQLSTTAGIYACAAGIPGGAASAILKVSFK